MFVWIQEHPYLSGTLAVGIIVLFLLFRRSNSGGSGGGNNVVYSGGASDVAVQSGAALQYAQMSSQTQIAGYNAAVNIRELETAADVEKSRLARDVYLTGILSGADVSKYTVDAQLKLGLAQVGQQTVLPASVPAPATQNVVTGNQERIDTTQAVQKSIATQIKDAVVSLVNGGYDAGYRVNGGGPGADIHGVDTAYCDATLNPACANANMAGIQRSYDEHPGSYLGGGVYAGTEEAWKIYGDPRVSYADHLRGDNNPYA